ncbi:exosortase [candidate division WS5 bacterium]|uniref:Exosortase n=1 Tax=candidate division WS5 bacterium TaxID=2093353 RepID=A0A419DEJ0_9BACT|nr:MAG: exosortase [candidate division WS5 bacterium]
MLHFTIWILVVILYLPAFWKLYQARWETIDYTHAYFILPISIWLTWHNRLKIIEFAKSKAQGKRFFSFLMLLVGISMFIFGSWQDYFFIITLSLIPMLFGLVSFLYGREVTKIVTFPILYILLLVPPPLGVLDSITLPMRHGISFVTEKILFFLNYPIKREGLLLTIGYIDIFMGQPCSGFRSLITMFSLVLAYVYISKGGLNKKFILTSFIVPFALIGNLIRVITLCLITYYFGEEAGQGFFHNFSGIVVFVITILGIIGLESLLDKY